jgi:hypothetical protein
MNDERAIQLLRSLMLRLRSDPEYLAHTLAVYQKREGLSDEALAQRLGAQPEMLLRLALCRRPAIDAPDFADQVRELADFTLIDEVRLERLIRELSNVAEMKSFSRRRTLAHLLDASRNRIEAFTSRPISLIGGVACMIFLILIAVLTWREYHEESASKVARNRPQPTATSTEVATSPMAPVQTPEASATSVPTSVSPATKRHSSVTLQGQGEEKPPLLPEISSVEVDVESYALSRGVGVGTGEGQRAIELMPLQTRFYIKLPDGNSEGRYRVSILDAVNNRPLASGEAISPNGRTLSVIIDLRGFESKKYYLRLSQPGRAPIYCPVSITEAKIAPR